MIMELRYLIMRTLRLLTALVCEATMVLCCVVFVFFTFFGILSLMAGEPVNANQVWWAYPARYPIISGLAAGAAIPMLFGLAMACGLPYRYKSRMPGISTAICDSCGQLVPRSTTCRKCGEKIGWSPFRWLVSLGNSFVTGLWVTHDAVFIMFGVI